MVDTYKAGSTNGTVLLAPRQRVSMLATVGRGLQELGGAVDHVAEIEQRRTRSHEIATGMGRFAEAQVAAEERIQRLRTQEAKPGADGHEQAAGEFYRQAGQEFLASLPDDPEVRDRFLPMVSEWALRGESTERTWARGQRTAFQGEQVDSLLTTMSNGQLTKPDPTKAMSDLNALDDLLDGMDLEPDERMKIRKRFEPTLIGSMLDGLHQTGQWQAAQAMVQSGQLDAYLDPAHKKAYLQRGALETERAAREAERAQAETAASAKDALETIKVRIDNGDDVPPGEIAAALSAAQTAGVKQSDLLTYAYLSEDAAQAAELRGLNDRQLDGEVQRLRGLQSEGKLDARQTRMLDKAEAVQKDRDEDKGSKLGTLLKGGMADQLTGMGQLAAMPADERWRVATAAGSPKAAVLAGLPPEVRQKAARGAGARAGRDADYLPPKDDKAKLSQRQVLDRAFDHILKPGLARQIRAERGPIIEAAMDIMAENNRGWDGRDFGRAVQIVFGMNVRSDGTHQGGLYTVEGHVIELPPKWSGPEFAFRYAKNPFAEAVYTNGATAKPADVRRHFRPEFVSRNAKGEYVYRMIGPDGGLLMKRASNGGREPYLLPLSERPL